MAAVIVHKSDGPWLVMPCPKKSYCEVPVHRGPPSEDGPRGRVWQWEGPEDAPTIKPSIGCDFAPRCGQHRVITNGRWAGMLASAEAPKP